VDFDEIREKSADVTIQSESLDVGVEQGRTGHPRRIV
jgi:hypothetical protein